MSGESPSQLPPHPQERGRRQRAAEQAHAWRLLPALKAVRRLRGRDLRVLAYHRIREIGPDFSFDPELVSASPEAFRRQMLHLRERFHPVTCRDVAMALDGGARLPRDAVLVTFDDGYDDNHSAAFPILRELGVPATFFVATAHIDSGLPYAYDWLAHLLLTMQGDRARLPALSVDLPLPPARASRHALVDIVLDRLKYLDDAGQQAVITALEHDCGLARGSGHPDCRPMTWNQLREMHGAGMEIGGHSAHHRMLAKLPVDVMRAEVAECQARLTAELGAPAIAISYPVGGPDSFDGQVITAAAAEGFRVGFSYIGGVDVPRASNRYCLKRMSVERQVGQPWFEGILAAPELFSHPSKVRMYTS